MNALKLNLSKTSEDNQLQPVLKSKKINIFEKMEKRYGFKIDSYVMICEDKRNGENGFSDGFNYKFGIIAPCEARDRMVNGFIISNYCISSLDELYEATNTGFNSINHKINNFTKKGKPYKTLIPVILISYKRKTYSFRVDNNIIREFFWDTEKSIQNSTNSDELKLIEKRYLQHIEFLQYFYAPFKSKLNGNMWIKLYLEKANAGKGEMLISEYLEWKTANN